MNKFFNFFLSHSHFPLIGLGFYWIHFVFGWSSFFLIDNYRGSIFINGLYIFIFLLVSQTIFFLLLLNFKITKIFYDYVLHSFIFGYLFFFIIKFADINLHTLLKKFSVDPLNKIYFYIFPFILSFMLFYYLKNNKKKWLNYLMTLILVFISLTALRLFYSTQPDFKLGKNNFYESFIKSKKFEGDNSILKKKVIILIFDEFDYEHLIKNLDQFPMLSQFIQKSFFHKNFYSPAKYTSQSMSSIITGKQVKAINFFSGDLVLQDVNNKKILIKTKNTIFEDIKKRRLSSSIFGNFYPYCSKLNVKQCYDTLNENEIKLDFNRSLKILLTQLYIKNFYNLDKYINFLFKNNYDLNKSYYYNNKISITDPMSSQMINLTDEFFNTSSNLVFVHYPFPHLDKKIIIKDKSIKLKSNYEKNLYLIELTIKKINKNLDNNINSLLVITSDHWFRNNDFSKKIKKNTKNKSHRIPLIAKIIGDESYFDSEFEGNSVTLRDLTNFYFDGKIKSNKSIKSFFDERTKNYNVNF